LAERKVIQLVKIGTAYPRRFPQQVEEETKEEMAINKVHLENMC